NSSNCLSPERIFYSASNHISASVIASIDLENFITSLSRAYMGESGLPKTRRSSQKQDFSVLLLALKFVVQNLHRLRLCTPWKDHIIPRLQPAKNLSMCSFVSYELGEFLRTILLGPHLMRDWFRMPSGGLF